MENEQLKLNQAKDVFDTLCSMLENLEFKYEKNPEELVIKTVCRGDDLPIAVRFRIDPKWQLISLLSTIPVSIPEDKRMEMAIAVSVANYPMVDGSFDYDITDGTILFRMTSSFLDSLISEELLKYMLLVSCNTVDEYNDKFFMICKGMLSLEDFIKEVNDD